MVEDDGANGSCRNSGKTLGGAEGEAGLAIHLKDEKGAQRHNVLVSRYKISLVRKNALSPLLFPSLFTIKLRNFVMNESLLGLYIAVSLWFTFTSICCTGTFAIITRKRQMSNINKSVNDFLLSLNQTLTCTLQIL